MKKYIISSDQMHKVFKKKFKTLPETYEINSKNTKNTINDLLFKFSIYNKKILSVGSGTAFEEYWMSHYNSLTCIDIDEHNDLKPILKKLNNRSGNFIYYLGDASQFKIIKKPIYNVLYLSGFTLDELGRNQDSLKDIYSNTTKELIEKFLRKKGILIYQSYVNGYDCRRKGYIKALKDNLNSLNIKLIDLFHYKNNPGVSLTIGFKKASTTENILFCLKSYFKIKNFRFHGRSEILKNDKVIHAYNYLFPSLSFIFVRCMNFINQIKLKFMRSLKKEL